MRIFIGIPLEEASDVAYCSSCAKRFEQHACSGRFVTPENLHLTLLFLGETQRVSDITSAMDEVLRKVSSFVFEINKTGRFMRKDSSTIWVGGDSEHLDHIHEMLFRALAQKGFMLKDRLFRAHITLARNVRFSRPFDKKIDAKIFSKLSKIPSHRFTVRKVSLFSSKRIGSAPVYTQLYSINLKNDK